MLIKKLTLSLSLALLAATASAQCYTKSQQQGWLDKAEACKPVIKKTIHHPVREVKIVADKDAFQGYKAIPSGNIADLYSMSFKQKKEISSYNGYTLLNSYCHAWSCTPVYFIVNYPEIFQK